MTNPPSTNPPHNFSTLKKIFLTPQKHVVTYDATIAQYLDQVKLDENEPEVTSSKPVIRAYEPQFDLKYGANPHQKPSSVLKIVSPQSPHILIFRKDMTFLLKY